MTVRLWAMALALLAAGPAPAANVAWVQMTAAGAEARVITRDAACPPARVDGVQLSMRERAGPTDKFPNRLCAATLPAGARWVSVGGQRLMAPRARPSRIVVIGDTGCRTKGLIVQHCNDPSGWPFARVAALAARQHPDLVIHVGDYYYRESPCPWGNAACVGSPYGDRWETWKAELFDPAAPLLAAAPWVFARGNHEDCKRGGAGWFRLLDAAAAPKPCPAQSDTFAVELGGLRLYLVDSADTDDLTSPPSLVDAFARRLDAIGDHGAEPAWIVTHRPVWNVLRLGDILGDGLLNATERAAVAGRPLAGVDLILSGHVHNFASLSFGPTRPAQLIVGTGGDTLDVDAAPPAARGHTEVDGLQAQAFSMGRFGYFIFERRGRAWHGVFHDLRDRIVATCDLRGRSLGCKTV